LYAGRFRKNYTDELAVELVKQVMTSIRKKGDVKLGLELILTGAVRKLSREEQIKEAERYFTQAYPMIEVMIEGIPTEEYAADGISKGVREEYIEPLLEQYEKMKQFVESVRQIVNEDAERELTDKDIDQAFLDTFESHKGFSEFVNAYMGGMPCFFDLMVCRGEFPRAIADSAISLIEITKDSIPYLNERLFGDL